MDFENLKTFFDKVKTVGLIERIFFWKNIASLSYDAYEEFKSIDKDMNSLKKQLQDAKANISSLKNDVGHYKENITRFEKDIEKLKEKNDDLVGINTENVKSLAEYKKIEQKKQEEYEHKITELNSLKSQMDNDRKTIQEEREKEISKRFEDMKKTWRNHEDKVEQKIKNICSKCNIEHIDKEKVPFKGKPDNTIKIADEYIIFDAKSPANDNLDNFPNYLKSQAEGVKKYANLKEVKKDIFLVVPYNTLQGINQFFYSMGDYNVFIITIDSLEPIIKSLQKIEEYEFTDQLSPEERDNICRIIGKFAHASKRRIQVDNYFANEFIQILTQCNILPEEVLVKSVEFEKSEKLNPPIEKRAKKISKEDLKKEVKRIKHEASAKDIVMGKDLEKIEEIQLYKK